MLDDFSLPSVSPAGPPPPAASLSAKGGGAGISSAGAGDSSERNLIYTVAFDNGPVRANGLMAKMMAASALRSGFDGEIAIFHNGENALFAHGRAGVTEIFVSEDDYPDEEWRRTPHRLKFRLQHLIPAEQYRCILFLDADSLVIRNPAHLFRGCPGIAYQPEPGVGMERQQFNGYLSESEMSCPGRSGINSGTFAVRGHLFREVMQAWDEIDSVMPVRGDRFHEQAAWNRLLLDTQHPSSPFPDNAVMFPFFPFNLLEAIASERADSVQPELHPLMSHLSCDHYLSATVLHTLGPMPSERRMAMTFGLFCARFFADERMTLLNLLEP